MSEPTSPSDATPAVPPAPTGQPAPAVPPAPSFTYGAEQPAAPAAPPVVQPAPAYGVPAYGTPVYGAPVAPTGRRTWDLVLTIILFVMAVIGAGLGIFYGVIFLTPGLFAEVLGQQGYGTPSIATEGPGAVIVISHLLLFVLGVGIGILLLVKKKVAFYAPLAAGVIAAIIFWVVASQVFLSIPGFTNV
jgi:hypothetical protein